MTGSETENPGSVILCLGEFTWEEADSECEMLGGQLQIFSSPKTLEKLDKVFTNVQSVAENLSFWIGGYRGGPEVMSEELQDWCDITVGGSSTLHGTTECPIANYTTCFHETGCDTSRRHGFLCRTTPAVSSCQLEAVSTDCQPLGAEYCFEVASDRSYQCYTSPLGDCTATTSEGPGDPLAKESPPAPKEGPSGPETAILLGAGIGGGAMLVLLVGAAVIWRTIRRRRRRKESRESEAAKTSAASLEARSNAAALHIGREAPPPPPADTIAGGAPPPPPGETMPATLAPNPLREDRRLELLEEAPVVEEGGVSPPMATVLSPGVPQYWSTQEGIHLQHDWNRMPEIQKLMDETWLAKFTRDRVLRARSEKVPAGCRVVNVLRVENHLSFSKYMDCKARLRNHRGGDIAHWKTATAGKMEDIDLDADVNETYLFHGTDPTAAQEIVSSEFSISKAGTHGGTMFGNGIYFGENASKSDEYAKEGTGVYHGLCAVLICRVALGKVHVVHEAGDHSDQVLSGHYDSICGDRELVAGTYREFVLFSQEAVYPEFIAIYARTFAD